MENPRFPDGTSALTCKILVLDVDKKFFSSTLEMLANIDGRVFHVDWAQDFETGLNQLLSNQYQVALIEGNLGMRSGLEIIREATEKGCATAFILLSEQSGFETYLEAMQAGATLCSTKDDITPHLIERTIDYAIAMKEKKRRLRQENIHAQALEMNIIDALFTASPGILNIFDETLHYIKTDPITPTYFGLDQHSIIGKSLPELSPQFNSQYQAMMQKVIVGGQTLMNMEIKSPITVRGGETAYWRASYFPIPLPDGKRGMGVVGVDITDLKNTERALRESEARFRLAVEGIADEMWVCDAQGKISTVNLTPKTGLNPTAFNDKSVEEPNEVIEVIYSDGRYRSPEESPLLGSLHGETLQGEETIRDRTTGKIRYRRFRSAPIYDRAETVIGAVAIMWDITEQKRVIQGEHDQRRMAESLRDIAAALTETLDLNTVLDRILLNIREIASYDAVNFMMIEQDQVRIVRQYGYAERGFERDVQDFQQTIDDVPGLSWMAHNKKQLVIQDTKKSPLWKTRPFSTWINSYAGIPIQAQGKLIGFLNLDSATQGFFQPEQIDQLLPFADQAALAILNARAFEEIQQRSQRLAMVNRVAHALNRPLELQTVLQVTIDCMVKALNLTHIIMSLIDGSQEKITITADHPAPGNLTLTGTVVPIKDDPVMAYLLREKTYLLIEDAQHDDFLAKIRDQILSKGVYSMLIVPILVSGEVIGTIACEILEPLRRFTAEEIELAQTITNLAAVRIEQARLFTEERKRASALALLHVTSLDITMQNDLPTLLDTIIQRAAWLTESHGGTLYLANPQQQELVCRVCYNLKHDEVGTLARYGEGAVGIVAETSQPLIIPDYAAWPHRLLTDEQIGGFLTVASVPVIWQGQVTGVIQLTRRERKRPFTQEEIELLGLFSNQVAISLENTRLYNEVQQLAIEDALTGLYNRRGLFEIGQREIERARRFQRSLSVLMIDIDHFKQANDTYGHLIGDELLEGLANIFRKCLRTVDIVGRYGGEEFVVLLFEDDQRATEMVAERICLMVAQTPIHTSAGDIHITVSIGATQLDSSMTDLHDLILAADQALYQAKAAGRNRVIYV